MRTSFRSGTGLGVLLCALSQTAAFAEVGYPSGSQNFESMALGADVATLPGWVRVPPMPAAGFAVTAANDVLGNVMPRDGSTKWLRVADTDGSAAQNRFYTPGVVAPVDSDYMWTFYVNLEAVPPAPADPGSKPRITIQHRDAGNYANAWGIEFTSEGASLIVIPATGGATSSISLYSLSSPTGVGDWVKLELRVRFGAGTVSASVNDGPEISRPISPPVSVDKKDFRWCYRGENSGNINRMLVDDILVQAGPALPATSGRGVIAMAVALVAAATVLLVRRRRIVTA